MHGADDTPVAPQYICGLDPSWGFTSNLFDVLYSSDVRACVNTHTLVPQIYTHLPIAIQTPPSELAVLHQHRRTMNIKLKPHNCPKKYIYGTDAMVRDAFFSQLVSPRKGSAQKRPLRGWRQH